MVIDATKCMNCKACLVACRQRNHVPLGHSRNWVRQAPDTSSPLGLAFQPGEGIVQQEVEATVRATGHIGRVGMRETDLEILRVMLGVVRP